MSGQWLKLALPALPSIPLQSATALSPDTTRPSRSVIPAPISDASQCDPCWQHLQCTTRLDSITHSFCGCPIAASINGPSPFVIQLQCSIPITPIAAPSPTELHTPVQLPTSTLQPHSAKDTRDTLTHLCAEHYHPALRSRTAISARRQPPSSRPRAPVGTGDAADASGSANAST